MDLFHQAAERLRAEQFLQEKVALARPSVADVVHGAFLGQIEDRQLLDLAAGFCPTDPVSMYVKLGGQVKVAEPPPPKGVSGKEWDKQLQKGPPVHMEPGSGHLIRRSRVKYVADK
jgi:hypothetical protein